MDTSNLKNIIVLKDLPSNIVEEAIVVLKENQKIEKLELIDRERNQRKGEQVEKSSLQPKKDPKDYIIKEAQMLIAEYITKIENKSKKESPSFQILKRKNRKLKMWNNILIGSLLLSVFINFII